RVPVGTVAAKARIRHDRAQVAVEAHAVGSGGRQDGGAGAGDNTQDLSHDERAIAGEAGVEAAASSPLLFLRQRTVVFLDRLTESLGDLIGSGQRQRFVVRVRLPAQAELELFQLVDRRSLKELQSARVD